jgi:hypothetical protein
VAPGAQAGAPGGGGGGSAERKEITQRVPGVAEDDLVTVLLLGLEDDLAAVGIAVGEGGDLLGGPEQRIEALHRRSDLGAERGGGLDEGVAGGGVAGEEVGGELVLARTRSAGPRWAIMTVQVVPKPLRTAAATCFW